MTFKQIFKEIDNNISNTYLRLDFGFLPSIDSFYLIPTIELSKTNKFFEVNIIIFAFSFHFTLSKEKYYES